MPISRPIVERTIQREETELSHGRRSPTVFWQLRRVCRRLLVARHVQEYAIDLVMATQPCGDIAHDLAKRYIRYGSSPRGAQALVECGRVLALMKGEST